MQKLVLIEANQAAVDALNAQLEKEEFALTHLVGGNGNWLAVLDDDPLFSDEELDFEYDEE